MVAVRLRKGQNTPAEDIPSSTHRLDCTWPTAVVTLPTLGVSHESISIIGLLKVFPYSVEYGHFDACNGWANNNSNIIISRFIIFIKFK